MLTHIHIRDFAIVEELELDLRAGMTALTGETGAGKSILLDALNLALGDRADTDSIRHGADRAEISLQFNLQDAAEAQQWLREQAMDQDDECILRRIISSEGRSRGFINGTPVPMQSLKDLGELLVDIHGQHAHQSLLRREIQRRLLDEFSGNGPLLQQVQDSFHQWRRTREEWQSLQQAAQDRGARLDLLRYQVQELEALDLHPGELEALEEEHKKLANSGRLLQTCQQSLEQLHESDQGSLSEQLGQIQHAIEGICELDRNLSSVQSLLQEAGIQIQEAADELRSYLHRVDLDPQRLQWLDERMGLIHDLARKHRIIPPELHTLLANLQQELDSIEHADERLDILEKEIKVLEQNYYRAAKELSTRRAQAAEKLNRAVSDAIQELGMKGTRFEALLEALPKEQPSALGLEQVEFMISPNPGQPMKPLRKIASGGELSRASLAIQTILADNTHIPTLIYDEVDSGIGGPTAEVVGRQLRSLGRKRQVMCVTHLAQVASQAHQHLRVSKQQTKDRTTTRIEELRDDKRVEEVARMLGGIEITESSLTHAQEMIQRAQQGAQPPAKKGSRKRA